MNKNKENYNLNPTIKKNKLLALVKSNGNIEIVNKLSQVFDKINENEISAKKFMLLLSRDLENEIYCELLNNIINEIYLLAGYQLYLSSGYELYL